MRSVPFDPTSPGRARRRGVALFLAIPAILMLFALGALAVDVGRIELAKSELQHATDNVARHAAMQLERGTWQSAYAALRAAGDNTVAGRSIEPRDAEFAFGSWDAERRLFTERPWWDARVDSVRLAVTLDAAAGRGVPLFFAPLLGREQATVSAEVVVTRVKASLSYDARSQLYLAGMPDGSRVRAPWGSDTTRRNAATQVDLPIHTGQRLAFAASGSASNYSNGKNAKGPDGNTDDLDDRQSTADDASNHGISAFRGPDAALVGVFLSDDRPDDSAAPPEGDYSTPDALNRTELRPPLKQIFLIGSGRTPDGRVRHVVPPEGATRLFVGRLDQMCKDNSGGFDLAVRDVANVRTVR